MFSFYLKTMTSLHADCCELLRYQAADTIVRLGERDGLGREFMTQYALPLLLPKVVKHNKYKIRPKRTTTTNGPTVKGWRGMYSNYAHSCSSSSSSWSNGRMSAMFVQPLPPSFLMAETILGKKGAKNCGVVFCTDALVVLYWFFIGSLLVL